MRSRVRFPGAAQPRKAASRPLLFNDAVQTSSHQRSRHVCRRCAGVPLTGENALQRYDHGGMHRIRDCALAEGAGLAQFTFLRMSNLMFDHWGPFTQLVAELRPRYERGPPARRLVDR